MPSTKTAIPELLTTNELAAKLRVHRSTLWRARLRGELKCVRVGGRAGGRRAGGD